MSKILLVIIGLLALGGFFWAWNSGFQPPQSNIQPPSPAPTVPEINSLSEQPATQLDEETLNRLRTRLFEEGVTVSAKVVRVLSGSGFIVSDDKGNSLFVHWRGDPPLQDQMVSVMGVVVRISDDEIAGLREDPAFTTEVENALRSQPFFIEAEEITPR